MGTESRLEIFHVCHFIKDAKLGVMMNLVL
jgi:hypothetical protein